MRRAGCTAVALWGALARGRARCPTCPGRRCALARGRGRRRPGSHPCVRASAARHCPCSCHSPEHRILSRVGHRICVGREGAVDGEGRGDAPPPVRSRHRSLAGGLHAQQPEGDVGCADDRGLPVEADLPGSESGGIPRWFGFEDLEPFARDGGECPGFGRDTAEALVELGRGAAPVEPGILECQFRGESRLPRLRRRDRRCRRPDCRRPSATSPAPSTASDASRLPEV